MQQDFRFAPIDIDKYISLYNKGISLDQIKPLHNQTYRIFKECKEDIRIIDKTLTYEDYNGYARIQYFVKDLDYFYMIPVKTINETIVGFILRGVTKGSYSDISREFKDKSYKVPLMFGFNKAFKKLDAREKCEPIIVCEGSKDCLALKTFYPYVLANKTSSMGINAPILRKLTDKFIVIYDNDSAGKNGMEKDISLLRRAGATVGTVEIPSKFKDCADVYCDKYGNLNLREFSKLKKDILDKVDFLYELSTTYR